MPKLFLLLPLAVGLYACATSSSPSNSQTSVQTTAASSDLDQQPAEAKTETVEKQRCRRETSTGSRVGSRRVCD